METVGRTGDWTTSDLGVEETEQLTAGKRNLTLLKYYLT